MGLPPFLRKSDDIHPPVGLVSLVRNKAALVEHPQHTGNRRRINLQIIGNFPLIARPVLRQAGKDFRLAGPRPISSKKGRR